MSYKKNDILIFMNKEPQAHVCEMFGHGTIKAVDIECEPYYGFVKSVISASKGIYLMQTIKPIEGFICVAEKADIIRMAEKDELPETECVRKSPECLCSGAKRCPHGTHRRRALHCPCQRSPSASISRDSGNRIRITKRLVFKIWIHFHTELF